MKSRKILSIITGVIVIGVTFSGMFQFQEKISKTVSLLKTAFIYPTVAILDVNGFIKNISSENSTNKTEKAIPLNKKASKKKSLSLLFLLMGAVIISNEKVLSIFAFMINAVFRIEIKKNLKNLNESLLMSRWRYYLCWSLKFLTPVAKCILNRADVYDINPISLVGRVFELPQGLKPHFI